MVKEAGDLSRRQAIAHAHRSLPGCGASPAAALVKGSRTSWRWKGFTETTRPLYRLRASVCLYKAGNEGSLRVFFHFNLLVMYHVKHTQSNKLQEQ